MPAGTDSNQLLAYRNSLNTATQMSLNTAPQTHWLQQSDSLATATQMSLNAAIQLSLNTATLNEYNNTNSLNTAM